MTKTFFKQLLGRLRELIIDMLPLAGASASGEALKVLLHLTAEVDLRRTEKR